jgi:hypothetical protein
VNRRRHHRWIALFALFGLLFQQIAMATYLCPIEQSGRTPSAMTNLRAQPPCHRDAATSAAIDADLARCEQHCHPVAASADHTPSLSVPPALVASSWWPAPAPVHSAANTVGYDATVDPHAGAPPLAVRFCSFQI